MIVSVNGVATDNSAQLQEQISKYRPGDKVKVEYIRDNKRHSVDIKLLNPQGNTSVTKAGDFADLGVAFKKADKALLRQLGVDNGVQVAHVEEGVFADAGIRKGFVIVSINDTRMSSQEDIEKMYKAIMRGNTDEKVMIVRGLYPTGKRGIYAVDLSSR